MGHEIEVILSETKPDCNLLQQLPQVSKIEQKGKLRFILTLNPDVDLDTNLQEILQLLVSNGCIIRNFNLIQPSLEDVYLRYVKEDV